VHGYTNYAVSFLLWTVQPSVEKLCSAHTLPVFMFRPILAIDRGSYTRHREQFGLRNGYAEPIQGVPGLIFKDGKIQGTSPPGGTLSRLTRVVHLLHVKEPQAPRGSLSKIICHFPSKHIVSNSSSRWGGLGTIYLRQKGSS
jgi:hypothetical protein